MMQNVFIFIWEAIKTSKVFFHNYTLGMVIKLTHQVHRSSNCNVGLDEIVAIT